MKEWDDNSSKPSKSSRQWTKSSTHSPFAANTPSVSSQPKLASSCTDAYSGIWVRGEVSGLKLAASGHAYFTLKDDRATLRAACWKGA